MTVAAKSRPLVVGSVVQATFVVGKQAGEKKAADAVLDKRRAFQCPH